MTRTRALLARAGRLGPGEGRAIAAVVAAGLVALAAAAAASVVFDVTTAELFRDPLSPFGEEGRSEYGGVMSMIGILAWAAAAAVALFAASLARPGEPLRRFLVGAGTLTAVLGLDDLFRGHENLGEALGDEGDAQVLVLLVYGAAGAALAVRFGALVITRTPVTVLAAAAALLAFSAGLDIVADLGDIFLPGHYLVEDGPKFLGTLLWAAYLVIVARRLALAPSVTRGPHERPPGQPAPEEPGDRVGSGV